MSTEATYTSCLSFVTGDSFASGYANEGNSTCGITACTKYTCLPDLNTQDATLAWPALTAQNFSADYQLIAWEGVGVVNFDVPELLAAQDPAYAALPQWVQEAQYPLDTDLFARQVAGDNTSLIQNYSIWSPQVSLYLSPNRLHAVVLHHLTIWLTTVCSCALTS